MIIEAPVVMSRSAAPRVRPPRRARRPIATGLCCAYLVAVVAYWMLLRQGGDRWWIATVLMLAPRWPLAIPLVLGWTWAAGTRRWKTLAAVAAATLIVVGPILGVRASVSQLGAERGDLRLLTCNVHRQHVDPKELAAYITEVQADVVALQGWSDANRAGLFDDGSWEVRREGELLIASRWPITDVQRLNIADGGDTPKEEQGVAMLVRIQTPWGDVRMVGLHLASPHAGLNSLWQDWGARVAANVQRRWRESERLRAMIDRVDGPVLLAGDFNTTDDSPIFREHWGEFTDAFDECGWGVGYTYLNTHTQIRIDHVLAGPAWRVVRCWVGPDVGSAHRPVVAEVTLR
jgi:vancomycin resistance protein VanJ